MGLLSVSEAQYLVLSATRRLAAELQTVSQQLLGRILADDVVSDIDSPPFDKSMVDGYALRSVDAGQQATLLVVEEILAGAVSTHTLQAGQAASIMTGAPIPPGADAVVMHEVTTFDTATGRLTIPGPVKLCQNIMARASEMKQGEAVLAAGCKLRPQELGVLATVGKTSVPVYRVPRVAVLSTGDELVEPGQYPEPGQIRNSNASLLMSLTARSGASPVCLGIARDTRESLKEKLTDGMKHDVLLITGGVSAGKVDLVPGVLTELGVETLFHKVSLKPGKPLLFGTNGETLVFGLPGNPVSSYIGFELFVRPALRKLMGWAGACLAPTQRGKWRTEFTHKSDRPTYYPVAIQQSSEGMAVSPLPWKGSGDLLRLCRADGFAVLPSGEVRYAPGDVIDVMLPDIDLSS